MDKEFILENHNIDRIKSLEPSSLTLEFAWSLTKDAFHWGSNNIFYSDLNHCFFAVGGSEVEYIDLEDNPKSIIYSVICQVVDIFGKKKMFRIRHG